MNDEKMQRGLEFGSTIGEDRVFEKVASQYLDKSRWNKYRNNYKESTKCKFSCLTEYPIQIDFELNGTCNYSCDSCTYSSEVNSGHREMIAYDDYRRIIENGIDKGLMAVRYNYHNEPLLKRDIGKYILFAKQAGILDTYLSTNGSILDEGMSIYLISSGLDRLQVSIDAASSKTYHNIRKGGDYNKVVSNVMGFIRIKKKLGKTLPTLRVNFVKQPDNIDELEEFCSYWLEQGVDSIGIQNYQDWGVDDIDVPDSYRYQCDLPFNHLVIRFNGDILPCCSFFSDKLVIGNIKTERVEDVWNGKYISGLREKQIGGIGWRSIEICRKCVTSRYSGLKKLDRN